MEKLGIKTFNIILGKGNLFENERKERKERKKERNVINTQHIPILQQTYFVLILLFCFFLIYSNQFNQYNQEQHMIKLPPNNSKLQITKEKKEIRSNNCVDVFDGWDDDYHTSKHTQNRDQEKLEKRKGECR